MMLKKLSAFITLSLISPLALAALPGAASLSQTQSAPEPQQKLQLTQPQLDLPPTLAHSDTGGDSSTRIVLKNIVLTPNDAGLTAAQAQPIIQPYLNKPLTLAALHRLTDELTRYYQQQGYLLGQALLQPQQVNQQTLVITLVPGKYSNTSVENSSSVRSSLIQRMIDRNAPKNAPIKTREVQHLALLLQQIPGSASVVKFNTGHEFGTARLQVDTHNKNRINGYIGLDNQGDATIGKSRIFAGGQINNLAGMGDSLNLNVLDAYERSNLFSGNLDYNLLVNSYGSRAGISYSHLNYQYHLQNNKFSGYSDNYTLYIQHPLILQPDNQLNIQASFGQQFLTDKLVTIDNKKTDTYASVEINGIYALPHNAGVTSYRLADTFGSISDPLKLVLHDAHFNKINYKLDYQKALYGPLSLYASISGQLTGNNLDPSQKLIAGGAYALRGYDVGEGTMDSGTIYTLELRNHFRLADRYDLSVNAFFDQGEGRQYTRLAGIERNHLSLSDAGIYAELSRAGNFAVRLTLAKKTGHSDPNSARDHGTQFWVSAVKSL